MTSHQPSRRDFMQATALTGVGFWVAGGVQAQESTSPNEKIRFACIGVGGKGSSDSDDAGRNGQVVAVCDIDEKRLDAAANKFAGSEKFTDFREMLEKMGNKIDAVTVSTPDHTHAVAAAMAMKMGKHTFCQKPMTHSLYEARTLATLAAENKVATQMGNQGTSGAGLRKAAAIIKSGAIGTVKEVHIWTNRPIWPQGGEPAAAIECPASVKWDLWLGPAKERPYANGYHPFAWRGWWDFGTGALGDMACHTMNMPFMALDLRDPTSVEAETSGHNKFSYPKWSIIKYSFPERNGRAPVTMTWYDGGKRPDRELLGKDFAASGSLIIGDKGKIYSPNDYGEKYELLGGLEEPQVEFVKSPGHFVEFAQAIKGGAPAVSNFVDYAGPLTETVLLGNLAVWATGSKVEWDAKNLKSTNIKDLEEIIKPTYREGWTL